MQKEPWMNITMYPPKNKVVITSTPSVRSTPSLYDLQDMDYQNPAKSLKFQYRGRMVNIVLQRKMLQAYKENVADNYRPTQQEMLFFKAVYPELFEKLHSEWKSSPSMFDYCYKVHM